MHRIWLLDDVGQKKNEAGIKNDDIYRSVNPNWKGFLQTCVTTMTNTREAFFSSGERETKFQGKLSTLHMALSQPGCFCSDPELSIPSVIV